MATILLVEDDEASQELLTLRLTRRGYQVLAVGDGWNALALARSALPDLILMDIQLPGMSGLEATQQLKAAPETAAIPVIALTAYAMRADRERALAAGCDDYDTKPIDFTRLLGKIQALLPAVGDAATPRSEHAPS
ncbi:MAG TPA: response regulator [Chloroflexia bacterium]|nr:response regulator [Chloroflexia bacterium]